ncbi:unnamed protein product [Linum trigynum]|uniref:KIB1-4 beta-propeller domain-containing protein n=1 Tax=Linum trigynum TaxID=586398 RepID=A0AAV2CG62_9ROSI
MLSLFLRPANSDALFRRFGISCRLAINPEGERMLVIKTYNGALNDTNLLGIGFGVYEIIEYEQRWNEVRDIGGYALFYDPYKSAYISVKDHPECKRNCVYDREEIFGLNCERLACIRSDFNFHDWILPSNY